MIYWIGVLFTLLIVFKYTYDFREDIKNYDDEEIIFASLIIMFVVSMSWATVLLYGIVKILKYARGSYE